MRGSAAEQVVHWNAQRFADGVVYRDVDAAERRDEMALHAEMVEAVADLGRYDVEVKKAASGEERGEQLDVFADDTQRSGRVADADDAIIRGQRNQRAVAAIVDAAGIAVA